jgi:hypothetical protein
MSITNVTWVQDRLGRMALDLEIDERQAHIGTSQRSRLLDQGIVDGITFLRSDRSDPTENPLIHGTYDPAITHAELVGCTDDPRVFALFREMCTAIRAGTWVAGPRPLPLD